MAGELADLRAELLSRGAGDEGVRNRLIEAGLGGSLEADAIAAEVEATDRANTEWLKEVLERRGWPLSSEVGLDGAHAAWLLAQHADHDPAFQRRCLDLMAEAVAAGQAGKSDFAYLTDRVLLAERRPQRYGTQFTQRGNAWEPHELEDPGRVDQRRAEMGLGPLDEYAETIRKAYGDPPGAQT
ncbi:MAG: hypothetical protein M3Z97_02320 [Candidatus Dormibacteraeota bacterium]|nr:hypothetical protein [Candidatus Dormibacteraeota bacterium]